MDNVLKSDEQSFSLEYRFKRADDTYADIIDRAYLVRDTNGKPIRYIGAMQDISKMKELDRLKDEFLSVASHELRTPMTAIKGLVDMIIKGEYGPLSKSLRDPLQDVHASTDRLIHLVNDLLNVSRIEAGRLKFHLQDIELSQIVSTTLSTLEPIAKQKGLTLKLEKAPDVAVQVDTDKLTEIVTDAEFGER